MCIYVRSRSSWLRLQGDPRLPSREAIGTRTVGMKSLIILKLTIRGHTHKTLSRSVSRFWNVCALLTKNKTKICTGVLSHSQEVEICMCYLSLLTLEKCCVTDWIQPHHRCFTQTQMCHCLNLHRADSVCGVIACCMRKQFVSASTKSNTVLFFNLF